MEYLGEEKLKLLLPKEWLVKSDSSKATSYLFKFYSSTVDQCCCLMVTDTKHVWGEVVTSKQLTRRWRECNLGAASPFLLTEEEEDEWKEQTIDLLSAAHTLGAITDLSFGVVESRNADLAFEIRGERFKWRWDTYSLGPKVSAEAISQHLIMPLISVTHMAFSSPDAVGEQTTNDLEKAVDKVGRTARRTIDTHVKSAISKPRVATSLRRMTAVFNFLPDMPVILSEVLPVEMKLPEVKSKSRPTPKLPQLSRVASPAPKEHSSSPAPASARKPPSAADQVAVPDRKTVADESSATEPETDAEVQSRTASTQNHKGKARASASPGPNDRPAVPDSSPVPSPSKNADLSSEASSPARPVKKAKRVQSSGSDSDEDSEAERKRRLQRLKGAPTRGAKQPVKRGARRF